MLNSNNEKNLSRRWQTQLPSYDVFFKLAKPKT